MDLSNETPFVARLLRYQPAEDAPVQATIVVKGTFQVEGQSGARWSPAAEQMPIVDDKLETTFGMFHTDGFVRKDGVDVCVLGTVQTARPVRGTQLTLTVGRRSAELSVLGDRRWVRSGGRLVPSDPTYFQEMPLAYTHAYGGKTEHDYETVVFVDNPVGRGFYLSPERAEGQPLPNLEEGRGSRIQAWNDQVSVAGWGPYPMFWGIRAREGVELTGKQALSDMARLKVRANNNAHPALVLPELPVGSEIRMRGMRSTELVYSIPPFTPVAEVRYGDTVIEARGAVDGAFIWVDAGRMTLTARLHFSYPYNKGELRGARLMQAAARPGAVS
jgi:hypothetical protein